MLALQALRNAVVDSVRRHAGRVVPAPRVIWVDRLAVFPWIVDLAIVVQLFRPHPHQWPLLKAFHGACVVTDWAVAYEELMVAHVVHVHAHFKLHHLARCICSLRLLHETHIIACAGPLVAVSANGAR